MIILGSEGSPPWLAVRPVLAARGKGGEAWRRKASSTGVVGSSEGRWNEVTPPLLERVHPTGFGLVVIRVACYPLREVMEGARPVFEREHAACLREVVRIIRILVGVRACCRLRIRAASPLSRDEKGLW